MAGWRKRRAGSARGRPGGLVGAGVSGDWGEGEGEGGKGGEANV